MATHLHLNIPYRVSVKPEMPLSITSRLETGDWLRDPQKSHYSRCKAQGCGQNGNCQSALD